jgi:hypothetical protein
MAPIQAVSRVLQLKMKRLPAGGAAVTQPSRDFRVELGCRRRSFYAPHFGRTGRKGVAVLYLDKSSLRRRRIVLVAPQWATVKNFREKERDPNLYPF